MRETASERETILTLHRDQQSFNPRGVRLSRRSCLGMPRRSFWSIIGSRW